MTTNPLSFNAYDDLANQFTAPEIARAISISRCSDPLRVFDNDYNRTGVRADRIQAAFMFNLVGAPLGDWAAWGKNNKSIRGIMQKVSGPSSSGKSLLVEHALKFIDDTIVLDLSSTSPQCLVFAGGHDGTALRNKIINWDEENSPGPNRYTTTMKIQWQLTSKGTYTRGTTIAGQSGRVSLFPTLKGPITSISTTTDPPHAFERQYMNRCFWLTVRHNDEDWAEIMKSKLSPALPGNVDTDVIVRSWHCFVKLPGFKKLDPNAAEDPNGSEAFFYNVEIPYGQLLLRNGSLRNLSDDDLRHLDLLIIAITVHTLLCQFHRQTGRDAKGRLILYSDVEDFNAVLPFFKHCVLNISAKGLLSHHEAFLKIAASLCARQSMSKAEICQALQIENSQYYNYRNAWLDARIVEVVRADKRGGRLKLGPTINNAVARLRENGSSNRPEPELVVAVAERLFGKVCGFQPQHLPSGKEPCSCPLHSESQQQTDRLPT